MVLILLAVFGVLAGNTGDSPVISLGKSATDFTLAVGGVTWLKSAPLRVFMDGSVTLFAMFEHSHKRTLCFPGRGVRPAVG